MQFNPASGVQGVVQYAYFLINGDATKYPIGEVTRNVNAWYRRIVSWIWKASGDWTFDDFNYTTLPILTTTIVNNQRDYGLPTGAGSEYFEVERVEVLVTAGSNWRRVTKVDREEIDLATSEYLETSGIPVQYYTQANSLFLLPAPDTAVVTASAGLRIHLSRDIDEFTTADTTQEPGISRQWHSVLAYGAALDYAIAYGQTEKITSLREEIDRARSEIGEYYVRRNYKDKKTDRKIKFENYK